jgi:hypothetical protein
MLYFVRLAANSVVLSSEPVGREHSYQLANIAGMQIPVFKPRQITFAIFSWQRLDEFGQETAVSKAVRARFQNMDKGSAVPGLQMSKRKLVLEDGTITDTYWAEPTSAAAASVKLDAKVEGEKEVTKVVKMESESAKTETPTTEESTEPTEKSDELPF